MKIAKFFSVIFGMAGTLLMIAVIGLCLTSLNAEPRIRELPEGAQLCAEEMAEAINSGEYAAAAALMYGQPDLGMDGEPEDELVRMVWDLMQLNLSFSWQGDCYFKDGTLFRDASVQYVDAASVTEDLQVRAHALLTQRMEEATDMAQLYDEVGEFRQDLVDQVLKAALTQACLEDVKTITADVTVQLVHRDGQWWAIPDEALLTALSGGLA